MIARIALAAAGLALALGAASPLRRRAPSG